MKKLKSILCDLGITLLLLMAAFAVSVHLQDTLQIPEHVTTTFAFAVFLISLKTQGYVYGILAAFLGTLAINYAFTFPYFRLNFTIPTNLFSALVMIVISLMTSALTTKVKYHEAIKAESEKERMRANLLRAVSHDLRTPLTTIYGSSTALLENRDALNPQQERIVKGIQDDAQWLMRMVENLLSVTKIDSSGVKLRKTVIALDELMGSVVIKFKKRYPHQQLDLTLPEDLILVPMDPILIEQVLLNILENAVQHAEGMSQLSLTVTVRGKTVLFQVADDGCGIREDKLTRIFTGTYVGDSHVADGQKRNAGIGLSVCATIVHAHGGRISAKNRPEGGALLTFTLDMEEYENEQ